MTRPAARVPVRCPRPGEGRAIASLWRELWEAHEGWGGYPGTRDERAYAQLAQRLDEDARVRAGQPILGRHVHLVAALPEGRGAICGQVEGWFERHGIDASTAATCEVRSLVVTAPARRLGVGRALLEGIAGAARVLSAGSACVLAAEVLDPNPATAFYARLGYTPVSFNARMDTAVGARPRAAPAGFGARVATGRDALAVACLESLLAARRRAAGDVRFDPPRAVDATLTATIAAQLAQGERGGNGGLHDPTTLVAADGAGLVRGSASFSVHTLEAPFLPLRRALLGRFALDAACPAAPIVESLVALACRMARAQGAEQLELVDLSPPGTEPFEAAVERGAAPWSRIVAKLG